MRILLLGATGRTGRFVLQESLKEGHDVHCLARNSTRIIEHKSLTVFEGNPSQKADLERAIVGCDAIISVLNISRKTDFPWSSLRTPKTFLSEVMRQLIPLAETHSVTRVVICSAWGVGETKKEIPNWFRWFIDNSNIGWAYKDHERQEEILTESNLNWTIVRPVGLTNSKRTEEILVTIENVPKPSLLISRRSVAKFLLDSLTKSDLSKKKVVISKK